MSRGPFDRIEWGDGELVLSGVRFALSHPSTRVGGSGGERLELHKTRRMLDQYAELFAWRADFAPRHVLELGILGGGSLAFWFELFRPEKLVGVDIEPNGDSAPLRAWREERGLADQVRTYWSVDQADAARLATILDGERLDDLDLVIDDASHLYAPTLASFNALFPRLAPGGLYVIEDWKSQYLGLVSGGRDGRVHTIVDLVAQVARLQATSAAIRNVAMWSNFVVIERGDASWSQPLRPLPVPAGIRAKRSIARLLHGLRRRPNP